MKDNSEKLRTEVIKNAHYRMDESTRMIGICLDKIGEAEVWARPNNTSNSIGNLILHLCGNIRQYAIASLGQTDDTRERDSEFSARDGQKKEELFYKLKDTVQKAKSVMESSPIEELIRPREVQGFTFSGIGIIMHVVEHYSYHTGQIAFWTKQLKNSGLGFYDGVDLNVKNSDT
ncbi:MAG: DinB family protein [Bacteroidota bacterium]